MSHTCYDKTIVFPINKQSPCVFLLLRPVSSFQIFQQHYHLWKEIHLINKSLIGKAVDFIHLFAFAITKIHVIPYSGKYSNYCTVDKPWQSDAELGKAICFAFIRKIRLVDRLGKVMCYKLGMAGKTCLSGLIEFVTTLQSGSDAGHLVHVCLVRVSALAAPSTTWKHVSVCVDEICMKWLCTIQRRLLIIFSQVLNSLFVEGISNVSKYDN